MSTAPDPLPASGAPTGRRAPWWTPRGLESRAAETSARFHRNPMWFDGLCMALLSPLTLLATVSASSYAGGTAVGLTLGILFTLPLLWRRAAPDIVALVVAVGHVLQLAVVHEVLPGNLVVPVVLYTVARYGEQRRARWWLALGLAGSVAIGVASALQQYALPGANAASARWFRGMSWSVACAAVVLAAWFSGQWLRQRTVATESWRARAEALERERDKAMQLAAEEERSRIAREMHDVVAHSLSVIVVQSDGAGYLASHDELGDAEARLAQVSRAIETIGQTARQALGETRRLVGVLRHDGEAAELAPSATLDQVEDLVQNLRAAGIPATFTRVGDAGSHSVSPGAQMALYRVAQESLTNVLKHAGPGATVAVQLHQDVKGVELRIADTGRGMHETDGAGHGVIGMRERMVAWGGTLVAGARPTGGFQVVATVPAEHDGVPVAPA